MQTRGEASTHHHVCARNHRSRPASPTDPTRSPALPQAVAAEVSSACCISHMIDIIHDLPASDRVHTRFHTRSDPSCNPPRPLPTPPRSPAWPSRSRRPRSRWTGCDGCRGDTPTFYPGKNGTLGMLAGPTPFLVPSASHYCVIAGISDKVTSLLNGRRSWRLQQRRLSSS